MSTDPTAGQIRVSDSDEVRTITIDNPHRYNAVDPAMMQQLITALTQLDATPELRVILVTGAEGPAFCAGADVGGENPQDRLDDQAMEAASTVIKAITGARVPIVCGLNGVAAGVGTAIALACDLVVAKSSASLTLGFAKIGLMPDGGSTASVAAAIGRARAMRLALLSDVMGASEAYELGLISHLVEDADYSDQVMQVVGKLKAGPPLALAATKQAINSMTLPALDQALAFEHQTQLQLLASDDVAEGMAAFNAKRAPTFHGR